MAYVKPETVDSPKANWKLMKVVYNSGPGGWSAAEGTWDGDTCLGVRWNGHDKEDGVGNPQSRGYPTWFIMPDGLDDVVRCEIEFLDKTKGGVTCQMYRPGENDPDGLPPYEEGAWRVKVELAPHLMEQVGTGLMFSLPELPFRVCHPDRNYFRVIGGKRQGWLVDGKWEGDVYSNGVAENENPTDTGTVKTTLVENIMKALRERAR